MTKVPRQVVAMMTSTFSTGIERVWNTVTDNSNWAWRSDLRELTVARDGGSFVECTTGGIKTLFTITHKTPPTRYEFDMENDLMHGHWVGQLRTAGTGTEIEFTEYVTVKRSIPGCLVRWYLRRQQARYAADLRRALGERS